jgi:hypothetical protein
VCSGRPRVRRRERSVEQKREKAQDKAAEVTPAPPVPKVAPPVPAAPVPIPIGTMMVGHAEDRAEREADQMADSALARLATATQPTAHQHGSGCDHARRSPAAPPAGAVVGYEGGALDSDTSAAIDARRGTGRRLEADVQRRMQSAFKTDFSAVRVHDDETSATLNRTISARAFTTGNDIFFGKGQYAPHTPQGERVLAHELAHTLQSPNVSAIGRLVRGSGPVIRRNWFTDLFASCFPFLFGRGSMQVMPEEGLDRPRGKVAFAEPQKASTDTGPSQSSPVSSSPTSQPASQSASGPTQQTAPQTASESTGPGRQLDEADIKRLLNLPDGPVPMDALTALNDAAIDKLADRTQWNGPLLDILTGAFEADWFKTKECLVFWNWPGAAAPGFSKAAGLKLMKALTVLRGKVHDEVKKLAQANMTSALAAEQAKLAPTTTMHKALGAESGLGGEDQVKYKGSVGADSVTSDVDVSTGGKNSEIAVRVYNEQFRKLLKLELDPGTVFDLNVYSMDFIHGWDVAADGTKKTLTPKSENSEDVGAANAAARDEDQDIWSLVHVARYMPDDKEWADYVAKTLAGIGDKTKSDKQRDLFVEARNRAKAFEATVQRKMDELRATVDESLKKMGKSSWGTDNEHFAEGAVRMRASNQIYEKELLKVKDLRAQIDDLKKTQANPERLKQLIAELTSALSAAQLYANEVYGSGGATVHAVVGVQIKKKEEEGGFTVDVKLTPAQWQEAFTDNLGDVLKDFEHYGHAHGTAPVNYPYAAFKMGKYIDRMLDTMPHLAKGGLISEAELNDLTASTEYVALRALGDQHLKEKKGAAGDDPKTLNTHEFFKTIDAGRLKVIKEQAVTLGIKVRTLAANRKPLPQPVVTDPAQAAPTDLAALEKMTKATKELQAAVTGPVEGQSK